nr:hypothetical protein RKHAN_02421 [Rhizobium sp. Khangiran2]
MDEGGKIGQVHSLSKPAISPGEAGGRFCNSRWELHQTSLNFSGVREER